MNRVGFAIVLLRLRHLLNPHYRIFALDRTYTDVSKIEFYLNSFRFDEYEDIGHRYVIHFADIQFYQ